MRNANADATSSAVTAHNLNQPPAQPVDATLASTAEASPPVERREKSPFANNFNQPSAELAQFADALLASIPAASPQLERHENWLPDNNYNQHPAQFDDALLASMPSASPQLESYNNSFPAQTSYQPFTQPTETLLTSVPGAPPRLGCNNSYLEHLDPRLRPHTNIMAPEHSSSELLGRRTRSSTLAAKRAISPTSRNDKRKRQKDQPSGTVPFLNGEGKWECPIEKCTKSFETRETAKKHLRGLHKTDQQGPQPRREFPAKATPVRNDEGMWECPLDSCAKSFDAKDKTMRHLLGVHKVFQYASEAGGSSRQLSSRNVFS